MFRLGLLGVFFCSCCGICHGIITLKLLQLSTGTENTVHTVTVIERMKEREQKTHPKCVYPGSDAIFFFQKTGGPEKNVEMLCLIMIVESGTRQGNRAEERRRDVQSV